MTRNFLKGALRRVLHEYTKGKSTERLKEAREVMLVLIAEEIDSYLNRRAALDELSRITEEFNLDSHP